MRYQTVHMRARVALPKLVAGWQASLQRRRRNIEAGLRLPPPAICMWATRAPSGRLGCVPAMPAARWSCAWKTSIRSEASPYLPKPLWTTCAGWAFAGTRDPTRVGRTPLTFKARRRPFYLAAWRRLLRRGWLYPCRCSRKDLESALGAPHESSYATSPAHRATASSSRWTTSPSIPVPAAIICGALRNCRGPRPATLKCPKASTGGSASATAKWSSSTIRIWARSALWPARILATSSSGASDGGPSYQLACVADDASMGITEVVRGADLLKSTARQILLYRALELQRPCLVSLPPGG